MIDFRKFFAASAVVFVSSILAGSAHAYDWTVEANVSVIEPTYLPNNLSFSINQNAGTSCPQGQWLSWNVRGSDTPTKVANAQAVLSVLMLAKAGSKRVRIFGNNANCTVDFIHLID